RRRFRKVLPARTESHRYHQRTWTGNLRVLASRHSRLASRPRPLIAPGATPTAQSRGLPPNTPRWAASGPPARPLRNGRKFGPRVLDAVAAKIRYSSRRLRSYDKDHRSLKRKGGAAVSRTRKMSRVPFPRACSAVPGRVLFGPRLERADA